MRSDKRSKFVAVSEATSSSQPVRESESEATLCQADDTALWRSVRDELAQIRAARQSFEEEKHAAEKALAQQRQELDQQSQVLLARLHELREAELRLAKNLEDALPARFGTEASPENQRGQWSQDSQAVPEQALGQRLRDQQMVLERVGAERDVVWKELQKCRDQAEELASLRSERDALRTQLAGGARAPGQPPPGDLHRRVELLKQHIERVRTQRDQAWSSLQDRRVHLLELEQIKRERDAALADLRARTESLTQKANDDSWVNLDSPETQRMLSLQTEVHSQQEACERLRQEREQACAQLVELQKIPQRLLGEIAQVRAERDAAIASLRQLSIEPESWTRQEAEFAAARLQLKQEQRQLANTLMEQRRREIEERRKIQQSLDDAQRNKEWLASLGEHIEEFRHRLCQCRDGIEARERDLRSRDAQIDLREAEVREMAEVARIDAARERLELRQERLRLARVREATKLERGALHAALEHPDRNAEASGT
jgi:hypothetical protein